MRVARLSYKQISNWVTVMTTSGQECWLEHWQEWARRNSRLFTGLRPGSKIAFLSKEEFAALHGRVLILKVADGDFEDYLADFAGFRQGIADVLFVAPADILVKIKEAAGPNEGGRLLKDFVRHGQILFYCLSAPEELEAKGFSDFLSNFGLFYLGGCVS